MPQEHRQGRPPHPTATPCGTTLVLGISLLLLAVGPAPAQADSPSTAAAPASSPAAPAAGAKLGPKSELGDLSYRGKTYRRAIVRELREQYLLIQYDGGLVSLPVSALPEELRQRLPAAAGAPADNSQGDSANPDTGASRAANTSQALGSTAANTAAGSIAKAGKSSQRQGKLDKRNASLVDAFGSPAPLRAEVDLRPRFQELGLSARAQGARANCVIFALIGAAEYCLGEQSGETCLLSEEYTLWTTIRIFRPPFQETPGVPQVEIWDMGFTLPEVATAMKKAGLALRSEVPDEFRVDPRRLDDNRVLPPATLSAALKRRNFRTYRIHGDDTPAVLNNFIHVLNNGIPVVVGLHWPSDKGNRIVFIDKQPPSRDTGADHAILLTGYRCPSGRLEDAVFTFRNSRGTAWGSGGYGQISATYLLSNVMDAIVLLPTAPEQ